MMQFVAPMIFLGGGGSGEEGVGEGEWGGGGRGAGGDGGEGGLISQHVRLSTKNFFPVPVS